MLDFFSPGEDLINILNHIERKYKNEPIAIISDFEFFFNKKKEIRSEDENIFKKIKKLWSSNLTVSFFFVDENKDVLDMNYTLDKHNLPLLEESEILGFSFLEFHEKHIEKIKNLIKFKGTLQKKNYFLNSFTRSKVFNDVMRPSCKVLLLFSSLYSLLDYISCYELSQNVFFISYPLYKFTDEIMKIYQETTNKIIKQKLTS